MKRLIPVLLVVSLLLSLTACGGKEKAPSLDVNTLYESYSEHLPEMFFPDDATLMNFLGINVEDCTQYKVAICAEGLRADEVWLIEARDQAALEKLQELAQSRIVSKLDETETYVPDQYLIVQKAEVLTNGLYLALLISPDVDTLEAEFEAAFQS